MQETWDTISFVGGLLFGVLILLGLFVLFCSLIVGIILDRMNKGYDRELKQMFNEGMISLNEYRGMHNDNH